jgi:hypothetical protein
LIIRIVGAVVAVGARGANAPPIFRYSEIFAVFISKIFDLLRF